MRYRVVIFSLFLSPATAFTFTARQWINPTIKTTAPSKMSAYDQSGSNDRIEAAFEAWCKVYGKNDRSRYEIFAYHYLLAEQYFKETGAPVKLNEFADLTAEEYRAMNNWDSSTTFSFQEAPQIKSEVPLPAVPESAASIGSSTFGTGLSNYLDSVPQNPVVGGPGMTSYLDTVPQSPSVGGAGMTSYLDSVGNTPAAPFVPPAAQASSAVTPVEISSPEVPVQAAPPFEYVRPRSRAVSYTHLTLPTILLV